MAKILIIDDDTLIVKTLSRIFVEMGHEVSAALRLQEGVVKAGSEAFDVVFLDVRLPDGNGLEQLPVIQSSGAMPEVIILTGYADPDSAEIALKNRAWDYIEKPVSLEAIRLVLHRALQYREEKLASATKTILKSEGIIGKSPAIRACLNMVARSADSNANILIAGETGTGKEMFARAIHANSRRAGNNFVVVDCGSLPRDLIESILFGHTKGAFTGADRPEEGLVKHADKGTLFLDEVGELPLPMQKAFLRVIQERRFRPIGDKTEIKSDFRLVAATNRDLDEAIKARRFREDLLFRLRSITLNLPPLRARVEDIKELVLHHMITLCESYHIGIKGYSPDFIEVLKSYTWPGNVRELFSALEYAVTQALHEPTLFPMHLPEHIRIRVARTSLERSDPSENEQIDPEVLSRPLQKWQAFRKIHMEDGEKRYLKELMVQAGGVMKQAGLISGLSQPRLYELLRKYGMSLRGGMDS
jgi:two-component system, NtrC family, response regulator